MDVVNNEEFSAHLLVLEERLNGFLISLPPPGGHWLPAVRSLMGIRSPA